MRRDNEVEWNRNGSPDGWLAKGNRRVGCVIYLPNVQCVGVPVFLERDSGWHELAPRNSDGLVRSVPHDTRIGGMLLFWQDHSLWFSLLGYLEAQR